MTVRRATPADVTTLSAFGRRVFAETFASDNHPDDLRAYLDEAYTEVRQREEVSDEAIDTLLVEEGGQLTGFAQLRGGPAGDGVTGPAPIELWRFYVDHQWHGRGVATELLRAVHEAAVARGAATIWLGVWERNLRAQAFYKKHGFVVVGSHVFMMGTDAQRDLIMAKAI